MTEAEGDAAHERYMEIAKAITALVDKMTKDLPKEQDQYVRDILNDTYRFWRK